MKQKPRSTKETLFNKELISEVLTAGLFIGLLVFSVWVYLINKINMDVVMARGYVMALMVFIQNIHVFNGRSEKNSAFSIKVKSNPLIIIAFVSSIILQIIVMEVPLFSQFLQTVSIPPIHLLYLFILATVVLFSMEIYKKIKYHNN